MSALPPDPGIQRRYQQVYADIAETALACGRNPHQVRLVVVTKGHPLGAVRQVIEAGARLLGENYVEEAVGKMSVMPGDQAVEWHMIGHVQSRKARQVSQWFSMLHSLDSTKLALKLSNAAGAEARRMPVLLECNTSGEESKYGFSVWQESRWEDLLDDFRQVINLPNLEVRGLMTMAPFFDAPEAARPFFARLRRLRDFLNDQLPGPYWQELSMGMSGDYQAAIQEGATLVRIGTAIMGSRSQA